MCKRGSASAMNGRGSEGLAEEASNDARDAGNAHYLGSYYLTPSAATAITKFQYNGSDRSLIYKYILSPLAQFLVETATPRTVSPNTITLSGLSLMVASYCTVWYHCPDLDGTVGPRWVFAFNCAAMLIYQTLDNMDGKQARRTGSSSPLGLLFDHGCDAINSIFGSANWIAAMAISTETDALTMWVLVIFPMVAFYVTTWEEYYTGKLVLPIINGPTEGLIMGAALSLTSAIWGPEYWLGMDWFEAVSPRVLPFLPSALSELVPEGGVRNCDIMAIATVAALFREVIEKTVYVCRRYGPRSLLNLVPLLFLAIATLAVGWIDPSLLVRRPRTCLSIISALFVEMVTQLMLDHIAEQPYNPYRPCLLPLGLLIVSLTCGREDSGGLLSSEETDRLLLAYAVGTWVYLVMKIRGVVHEICSVLGIWCFDIVTPRNDGGPKLSTKAKGLKVS